MNVIRFLLILAFSFGFVVSGQAQRRSNLEANELPLLTIKGSVFDTEFMKPVPRVNVEVMGGSYATTNGAGEFTIQARVGDELIFRNAGFETVYYTVEDAQRIRVEVQRSNDADSKASPAALKKRGKQASFQSYLDNANAIYKKDAKKGIEFIAQALENETASVADRAQAFKLLGDLYVYWNQYDLAASNYKSSLDNLYNLNVEIDLANAYYQNNNYQESLAVYNTLKVKAITDVQRISIFEGLGDVQKATGDFDDAITSYKQAEKTTRSQNKINAATRINAKIADTYDLKGLHQEAVNFYDETLELSSQNNTTNAARAKIKVADYFNKQKSFDEEISLRKEVLNELSTINLDTIANDDAITPQRQNYKIANAYVAQQEFDAAIPFFEKSISEASEKEDIIVEKDATRRLSELYRDTGDFDKAAASYERYVSLVDADYVRKEQEIRQAARFGKEIAEQQNRILSLEKDRELNESRYQIAFQEQELSQGKYNRQRIIIVSLIVVAFLLVGIAFAIFRNYRQQKYANNLLALRGLRSQMNPHFIFNALNSVNSFIASNDERTANQYLADFSGLMRSVLENSEEDFIPLSSEIELIKKYVMLEHFRFKDKFEYTLEVDEYLKVDDFEIPPMLLQPYVENAVWHGLRYKEEKGLLSIKFFQRDENTAVIEVSDDGVGRTKSKALKTENQKKQKSKGMSNIKKRIAILNEMYDDRIDVAITDAFDNGEGTKVTLILKED